MRATPIFKPCLVALALALALPGSALALGLGKLTVDSALGEPLSARVDLTSATREELDTLTARIADPSIYRQNNLTYQAALARTRVIVETGSDGVPYLRVSSPVSVLEPFLDLIVEVNWSSGRVVRDYTLLLDPPGINRGGTAAPMAPLRQGTGAASPPARASAAPSAASAPRAPVAPGEGYTVKRGDTLAKIANENKASNVTLDQMLVALFNANQNAFVGNNMNRLRAGVIMTIPDADTAAAQPEAEAHKVVRVQAADWRAYRDRVAASAPEAGGTAGRAAAGSISTAVEEKTPAAAPGSDRLRVSREAQGKGATAEDAVARDKRLAEANSRIAQLEKMLADAQHAVDVKNQTLAQAQNRAETTSGKAAPTPPPPAAITTPAPAPAATPPVTPPATITAPATPPPSTIAPAVPPVIAPPPVSPPTEAAKAPETPAPATTPPSEPPKAVTPPPKAAPKAAAKAPKPSPSFFDQLTDAIPLWALALAAAAILGLIVVLLSSRRRKTTKFEDSIISGTDIKTNTVFGSTGGGVVNTGDNSLASDFSREGLGNIDTDEVDPIAEAEVYLAYGRDAQAEEILKDALKKDPARQEIYLKLLEIHAQHNKPSAFETVAAELYAQCQGQGEVWQKAVALGRQLDPNNPMFAEGATPPARAAAASAAADEGDVFTMGPDLTLPPKHPPGGIDMQLDDEITVSPSSGVEPPRPKTPADILAGADRTLARSASETIADKAHAATSSIAATAAAGAAAVGAAAVAAKSKMDLDFHLDDEDKPAPMRAPREPEPEPELAAAHADAPASAADRLARPAAAMELDKLDLSFDPDKATFEDPTPSVLDGQWHDAATKLDLAKAYQEMGDVEGAREILQEVLHEGDEQQRTEAQAILTKLG
jgi:pilus assembly protein FimV